MLKSILRPVVTLLLNVYDRLFQPRPVKRSELELKKLAKETSGMALYAHKACIGSRIAKREIQRLNVNIECRDIGKCTIHQDRLLAEYGKLKAPCLRIEEKGEVRWLDEPEEIVLFLHERFEPGNDNQQQLKSA